MITTLLSFDIIYIVIISIIVISCFIIVIIFAILITDIITSKSDMLFSSISIISILIVIIIILFDLPPRSLELLLLVSLLVLSFQTFCIMYSLSFPLSF